MTIFTMETFFLVTAIAFFTAVCTASVIEFRSTRKSTFSPRQLMQGAENSLVFLFDDEELIDATNRGRAMLQSRPHGFTEWRQFCVLVQPRFPDLPLELSHLASEGSLTIPANEASDFSEIRAEWWNGVARIELIEDATSLAKATIDPHSINAMNRELLTLRRTAEMSPYLVWQQTEGGTITWANSSYLALAQEIDGCAEKTVKTWPPTRLFETVSLAQNSPEGRAHRVAITFPEESSSRWFEVFNVTIDDESLHFATSADGVVKAETALREFVQTLTKTFAHLPTGLAIFDKKRQLALFNPALTDLTGLQPMFLSLRPTLYSFLDKLRESQVIPEPKNYKSWRSQMTELEAAAEDGTYSETWALPTGHTYRVTGRPHTDGAVAFLFEDISSEVSLTRRFRQELEMGQAVLDSFQEAIAVFSPDGTLNVCNTAYASLWGVDPGTSLGESNIADAMSHWREKSEPNSIWESVRNYLETSGNREKKSFSVRLLDGRAIPSRLVPVPMGGTLVAFSTNWPQDLPQLGLDIVESPASGTNKSKEAPLFKIEA